MLHLKDGLSFKPGLSDLGALASHYTVVFLLLTHTCGGQSDPQPMVAMAGDDVILPCHLETAADASDMTVAWTRPDLSPKFVHVRRDRMDFLINQNPLYQGRTSVFNSKLKRGDLSVKLYRVKLSDGGTYSCFIPDLDKESTVQLVVGQWILRSLDLFNAAF
ncbi:butyrophilin subfamily 3 member A2-like protein [Lates japonicus]|uniref:Butyrophilin subfamily 3 member A2-like protein n=1 Tax=Lates japonicus TaxID=270547 RepID=A0AAD3RL36_LATJO|nr:butyrophilin subfamily 3 member A2-like protein [Lates japonicus]